MSAVSNIQLVKYTASITVPLSSRLHKCNSLFISSISSLTPFFSSKLNFFQPVGRKGSVSLLLSTPSSSVEECNDASEEDASDYQVLTAIRSSFNDIVILETQESRLLLLDSTHNVHSIFNKGNIFTDAYWDQFATLPPIIPKGPIAIYGLGGGTAARLLLEVFPSSQLDGWELDEILIYKARDYLGLADLEKQNEAGGTLNVIIGDALSSSATIPGRYAELCLACVALIYAAEGNKLKESSNLFGYPKSDLTISHDVYANISGIIVDLFSEGKVLPQLEEVEYWLGLQQRLMPDGRIMINCGGTVDESMTTWESNSTIHALHKAFPTQLSWMKLPKEKGANYLALTGPSPDFTLWSDALPDVLRSELQLWKTCLPS